MSEESSDNRESVTTSALFGVAVIQALITIAGWLMFGPRGLHWFLWLILMGSTGIYVALGLYARRAPWLAVMIGAGLFAAYLIFQTANGVPWNAALIYRLPVASLLLIGLYAARRAKLPQPRQSYEDGPDTSSS